MPAMAATRRRISNPLQLGPTKQQSVAFGFAIYGLWPEVVRVRASGLRTEVCYKTTR